MLVAKRCNSIDINFVLKFPPSIILKISNIFLLHYQLNLYMSELNYK